MGKHSGRSGGDNVSHPLPQDGSAKHSGGDGWQPPSEEQIAADVQQIDSAYEGKDAGKGK